LPTPLTDGTIPENTRTAIALIDWAADVGNDCTIMGSAAKLPREVFRWCRRHGADARRVMLGNAALARSGGFRASIELALPVLLDRVGAHPTRFSAVTLEAVAYNVTTVATEPYAQVLFSEFAPLDSLTVAPTPSAAALITALESL
jgi:hypothetical protein